MIILAKHPEINIVQVYLKTPTYIANLTFLCVEKNAILVNIRATNDQNKPSLYENHVVSLLTCCSLVGIAIRWKHALCSSRERAEGEKIMQPVLISHALEA